MFLMPARRFGVLALALTLTLAVWSVQSSTAADEKKDDKADQPVNLTAKDLDEMWKDLTLSDEAGAKKAFKHICNMQLAPKQSVAFIKDHLKPISPPDQKKIDQWIVDLDSNDFNTREKSTTELERLGVLAKPALKQKLAGQLGSLEVRRRMERIMEKLEGNVLSNEELRAWRAMEVLEGIGTPEAKTLIEALSKGAPGARLTEDAQRALARLSKQTPAVPEK